MRILYAIQGTGNGHLSRARAVIPHLKKYGELDLLVSGTEAEVDLPYPIQYKSKGISFHYNKKAGIHYGRTLLHNLPKRILKEIRDFPVEKYDIVINDFEPISAWACQKKGVFCVALSHQAAYLSPQTPRPSQKSILGEFILKKYAPVSRAFAFHFEAYDSFIHTPVIRDEIRTAYVSNAGHYVVYLPAIAEARIEDLLKRFPEVEWHVFSRYTPHFYKKENIKVFPIENDLFIQSFTSCKGILTSAGFETPSEALFMGKKLLTSPILGQYEQACNAVALSKLGIQVLPRINTSQSGRIQAWLSEPDPLPIPFPNGTAEVVDKLMNASREDPNWPLPLSPPPQKLRAIN